MQPIAGLARRSGRHASSLSRRARDSDDEVPQREMTSGHIQKQNPFLAQRPSLSPKTVGNRTSWSSSATNEMEHYISMFSHVDTDANGAISVSEIGSVFSAFGHDLSDSELNEFMHMVDQDGNGQIDLPEFIDLLSCRLSNKPADEETEETLPDAFVLFDSDGDGLLSAMELWQALSMLGEDFSIADVEAMIKDFDRDGDGRITCSEFVELMTKST